MVSSYFFHLKRNDLEDAKKTLEDSFRQER